MPAASATPRTLSPLTPRSTADYQPLLEEATDDEQSHESEDDGPDDPAA